MNDQLFAEQRLKEALSDLKAEDILGIIAGIMDRIETFSKYVSQFDNISMLALKYGSKDATCNGDEIGS